MTGQITAYASKHRPTSRLDHWLQIRFVQLNPAHFLRDSAVVSSSRGGQSAIRSAKRN